MKKIAGLILALMMLVSMLPAALAEDMAEKQVLDWGGDVYYDADGHKVDSTVFPGGDAVVKMSKTVAPTGVENEFEVTLQVSTTQDIRTLRSDTPDAAVMLILDVSNSMDDCDHCGLEANNVAHTGTTYLKCPGRDTTYERQNYRNTCRNCSKSQNEHTEVTTPPTCTYVARLASAKAAAIEFLDHFVNDTGVQQGDARYVAIVDFASMAARRQNWIDVTNPAQLAAAKAVIQNLTVAHSGTSYDGDDDGGTNIEAALMLGANLWEGNETVKAIDYKYTILLTDGNPTYYVTDSASSSSTSAVYGTRGGGSSTTLNDAKDVGDEAKRILDLGSQSKLYSICYGTVNGQKVWDTKPFSDWNEANPKTKKSTTVGQWLEAFSTAAFDGGAEGNLFESFNSIISQIQLAAQAWKVEDQMGPYAVYGGEVPQSWNNKHSFSSNTLHWDVLSSAIASYNSQTIGQQNYVVLNYEFKYKVTLDNLNAAYQASSAADTNANAELDYAVLDESTGMWEVFENVKFPKPEVMGYSGTLSFDKGYLLNGVFTPLDGVTFTLVPKNASKTGTTWQATATSNNGKVEFANIPSGHEYWLYETNLDDKFINPGQMPVVVTWGDASSAALTNGQLINEAAEQTVGLTLKKAFSTSEHPDSVVFQISNAAIGYANEVTLNDANEWTVTLHGLQPGMYTIAETAEMDGYEMTSSATLNGVDKPVTYNYIQADLQAGDSSHMDHTVVFTNSYTRRVGQVFLQKKFLERDHDELVSGSDQITMHPMEEVWYRDLAVTIRLTDEKGNQYDGVLNSANNWTADMENVPVGTYTITEVVSPEIADHDFIHLHMEVNGTERHDGKIEVGQNAQITVGLENHYTHHVGDIRVVKTLVGVDAADIDEGHVFTVGVYSDAACTDLVTTIDVRKLEGGVWSGTSVDIPVGNYYLKEIGGIDLPTYNAISQVFDKQMVTVTSATVAANVNLVNTYEEKLGELTVVKNFVVPEDFADEFKKPQSISILVKDASNNLVETLHLTADSVPAYQASVELPMGQYYLSEVVAVGAEGTADVDGFGVKESWTDHATVSFAEDKQTKTITVTNTYTKDFGDLTITKVVEGLEQDEAQLLEHIKPQFLIVDNSGETVATISLPNEKGWNSADGWTKTIALPTGSYTLLERGVLNQLDEYHYTFSGLTINRQQVDLSAGYPFTIEENGNLELNAVNTYAKDRADLTIRKAFAEDSQLKAADFANKTIDVVIYKEDQKLTTVGLNQDNGWTATLKDLEAGVTYTMVEVTDEDAENTAAVKDYNLTSSWANNARILLTKDGAENTVTNTYTRKNASFTVRKLFEGIQSGDDVLGGVNVTLEVRDENGEMKESIELNAANNWRTPKEIVLPVGTYTLKEAAVEVPGYNHTNVGITSQLHPDRVQMNNDGSARVTLVADQQDVLRVQVTNTMEKRVGTLEISKKFVIDNEEDFTYPTAINVLVKKADGSLYETVTLKKNENGEWKARLENVPEGKYQVEEVVDYGLTNSAWVKDFGLHVNYTASGAVEVADGQTAEMEITNQYTQHVGYLKVTKKFAQDEETLAAEKLLTRIAIVLEDTNGNHEATQYVSRVVGPDAYFGPIPVGDYIVKEVIAENAADSAWVKDYELSFAWSEGAAADGKVTITTDHVQTAPLTAVVTNTYTRDKGYIKVNKIVEGLEPAQYANKTFTVYIKQAGVTVDTLEVKPGVEAVSKALPTGEYLIVEDEESAAMTDYDLSIGYSAHNVTVTKAGEAAVTLTNTYTRQTGALKVTKTFDPAGISAAGKSIVLEIKPVDGGESKQLTLSADTSWKDSLTLDVGKYIITETTSAEFEGYTFKGVTFTSNGVSAADQIEVDMTTEGVTVHAENHYSRDHGNVTIRKEFADGSALDKTNFTGSIDVIIRQGETEVARGTLTASDWEWKLDLPTGTYTVEEVKTEGETNTAYRTDYTLQVTGEGTVAVAKGEQKEIVITNHYTRHMGSIAMTKKFPGVEEAAIPQDLEVVIKAVPVNTEDPTVEFVLNAANDWTSAQTVAVGAYTFVEEMPEIPDYTASSHYFTPEQVVVTKDATVDVVATNVYTKMPGSLKLTKVLKGDETLFPKSISFVIEGQTVEYQKTVELMATQNWTTVVEDMPAGDYIVRETVEAGNGYKLTTEWSIEGGKVTVLPNKMAELTCTNTYDPKLSIRIPVEKTVQLGSTMSPEQSTFTFAAQWQGSEGVSVRFENDALNTHGMLRRAGQDRYEMTVIGAGTVRGYIVLEGYASDLVGFRLKTRELLTGYDDAITALAAGWTFDTTATDGVSMWNVELTSDGKGKVVTRVQRTGERLSDRIAFVNVYTKDAPLLPPQTGDNANPILWMALCLLSGFGLAVGMKKRAVSQKK